MQYVTYLFHQLMKFNIYIVHCTLNMMVLSCKLYYLTIYNNPF